MGLFGDKDVKIIDRELTMMRLAITVRHRARSADQFENGLVDAVNQSALAARRLDAKGRRSEVLALLDKLKRNSLSGEDQELFETLVEQVRGALDRPDSDFERH